MITPQLKADEIYNDLLCRIASRGNLSEFEYRKNLKLLNNDKSSAAICAIGFAHALAGRNDDSINWFKSFLPFSELFLLKGYGATLHFLGKDKKLIHLVLDYADYFSDIWFSWTCMEYYYTIGDIPNSARKALEFLSMLPDNESKRHAEYSIHQQINSLSLVYDSGLCTPEQFKTIFNLAFDILEEYNKPYCYVELFYYEGDGASYEVGIVLDEDDFTTLSVLNKELIKRMMKKEELDNCELTPCFSHDGMSHWRYIHAS
ncbi:hypothetical protein [Sodalis sp.]|uniref:hypothetical protein n=1 Tax=Sodalis sp. (in: enterobacteria) TaxID=1898979 RepID=UPI003873BB8A